MSAGLSVWLIKNEAQRREALRAVWVKHNHASPDKRTADGIVFRSIVERDHYLKLKALAARGAISKLQYEPTFKFIVNGVLIGSYRPDFVFHDEHDRIVVHDCKGWKRSPKTGKLLPRVDKGFAMRRQLMKACFALEVELV